MQTACRGIRGATTVTKDDRDEILRATRELLTLLMAKNHFTPDDVAAAFFTTTPDLVAEYPAVAARELGWTMVPMLCSHEMAKPGGLPRCIRVLVLINTALRPEEIQHVYLGEARQLRLDLVEPEA